MTSLSSSLPPAPETHEFWMRRCITLARRAAGLTAPNPMVGCVIVKDGKAVGEGFHPKAGEPHAEVFALRAAGADHPDSEQNAARGATLYVNLEPCNHYGRTPPCTEAVIRAQVSQVVVGMVDPDPRVSGGGIERLRTAGIEVIVGVEEVACRDLNEGFIFGVQHQRPFGILKYAMTLDGKIATATGHSAWVTGDQARSQVHQLRSQCDAVIVGTNTVFRDNPRLTSHRSPAHNPLRVVMSRSLNLPRQAHLWQTDVAPTIVFTEGDPNPEFAEGLREQKVDVISLKELTPCAVFEELYWRGYLTVLWECGGTLAAQAIAQGCVQKVLAFVAPKIIGGRDAPSPVGELGFVEMTEALRLDRLSLTTVGEDYLLSGYTQPEDWRISLEE